MVTPQPTAGVAQGQGLPGLGPRYPTPTAPNLASRVRNRIVAQPIARPRRLELWRDPRRLALVAAGLLLLAGAAAGAHPPTPAAIAPLFPVRRPLPSRAQSTPPPRSPLNPP